MNEPGTPRGAAGSGTQKAKVYWERNADDDAIAESALAAVLRGAEKELAPVFQLAENASASAAPGSAARETKGKQKRATATSKASSQDVQKSESAKSHKHYMETTCVPVNQLPQLLQAVRKKLRHTEKLFISEHHLIAAFMETAVHFNDGRRVQPSRFVREMVELVNQNGAGCAYRGAPQWPGRVHHARTRRGRRRKQMHTTQEDERSSSSDSDEPACIHGSLPLAHDDCHAAEASASNDAGECTPHQQCTSARYRPSGESSFEYNHADRQLRSSKRLRSAQYRSEVTGVDGDAHDECERAADAEDLKPDERNRTLLVGPRPVFCAPLRFLPAIAEYVMEQVPSLTSERAADIVLESFHTRDVLEHERLHDGEFDRGAKHVRASDMLPRERAGAGSPVEDGEGPEILTDDLNAFEHDIFGLGRRVPQYESAIKEERERAVAAESSQEWQSDEDEQSNDEDVAGSDVDTPRSRRNDDDEDEEERDVSSENHDRLHDTGSGNVSLDEEESEAYSSDEDLEEDEDGGTRSPEEDPNVRQVLLSPDAEEVLGKQAQAEAYEAQRLARMKENRQILLELFGSSSRPSTSSDTSPPEKSQSTDHAPNSETTDSAREHSPLIPSGPVFSGMSELMAANRRRAQEKKQRMAEIAAERAARRKAERRELEHRVRSVLTARNPSDTAGRCGEHCEETLVGDDDLAELSLQTLRAFSAAVDRALASAQKAAKTPVNAQRDATRASRHQLRKMQRSLHSQTQETALLYKTLLDSPLYRGLSSFRVRSKYRHRWDANDRKRFLQGLAQFGNSKQANRDLARFLGRGIHANHVAAFRRSLSDKMRFDIALLQRTDPRFRALSYTRIRSFLFARDHKGVADELSKIDF